MDWKDLFQEHILNRGYNYYCENLVEDLDISEDMLKMEKIANIWQQSYLNGRK